MEVCQGLASLAGHPALATASCLRRSAGKYRGFQGRGVPSLAASLNQLGQVILDLTKTLDFLYLVPLLRGQLLHQRLQLLDFLAHQHQMRVV